MASNDDIEVGVEQVELPEYPSAGLPAPLSSSNGLTLLDNRCVSEAEIQTEHASLCWDPSHHPHPHHSHIKDVAALVIEETESFVALFLRKLKGNPHKKRPPYPRPLEVIMGLIGGFCGISFVAALHYNVSPFSMIMASLGASAVLVYGAIESPLAQPRNLVLGHLVSAFVGLCIRLMLTDALSTYSTQVQAVLSGMTVGLAIMVMYLTESLHPPGGATSLIALWLTKAQAPAGEGFLFLVFPVLTGSLCLLLVAVVVNNIPRNRRYPQYWW